MGRSPARAESDVSIVTEGFSDNAQSVNLAMDDRALVAEGFVDTIRNHVDGILTQSVGMSRRVSAQKKHIARLKTEKNKLKQRIIVFRQRVNTAQGIAASTWLSAAIVATPAPAKLQSGVMSLI